MNDKAKQAADVQPQGTHASAVPCVFDGIGGKAWPVDINKAHEREGTTRENDRIRGAWVIHAPWAHPVFHKFAVLVASMKGLPPERTHVPGATHEIIVAALHPEHEPVVDGRNVLLQPFNFVGQFAADSDDDALTRIMQDVSAIAAGNLNPDEAGQPQWMLRYGDGCLESIKLDDKPNLQIERDAVAVRIDDERQAAAVMQLLRSVGGIEIGPDAVPTEGCDCLRCTVIRQLHPERQASPTGERRIH